MMIHRKHQHEVEERVNHRHVVDAHSLKLKNTPSREWHPREKPTAPEIVEIVEVARQSYDPDHHFIG